MAQGRLVFKQAGSVASHKGLPLAFGTNIDTPVVPALKFYIGLKIGAKDAVGVNAL